ncbi:hypothetical protein BRW62_08080 [Parathermosynechococcus lividus PCC 6715]|uniref:Uncharacterized protein n=1 Tax=Parathermosynechococcus lividus PCC 6715 TaxID=1917166 RepID=A0A2D2Q2K3_PARLV|nr:hypothetical protein BRW62_08080 [Thermostichus lividus PCC 6715]
MATQILLLVLPTLVDGESASMLTYIALVSLAVALTLRTFEVQVRTLVFFLMMTIAVGLVEVVLVLLDADYRRISLVLNGFHLGITAMAVVLILRRIFRANVITGDSIRGGICVYRSDVGGLKPLRFSEEIQPTQGALAPSKVNYSCPELQCSAELFRC